MVDHDHLMNEPNETIPEDVGITQDALALINILMQFGLTREEVDLYLYCRGKTQTTKKELQDYSGKNSSDFDPMFKKLCSKKLFKELEPGTDLYEANPPFEVILERMSQYQTLLKDLENVAPRMLQDAFDQIRRDAIQTSKTADLQVYLENMNSYLIRNLENQQNFMKKAIEVLKERKMLHEKIEGIKLESSTLVRNQFTALKKQITTLQVKILKNLETMHLGVMADVVKSIIQETFKLELDNFQSTFNMLFNQNFQSMIDEFNIELDKFVAKLTNVGSNLDASLGQTRKVLSENLGEIEARLTKISENMTDQFNELQTKFSTNIIALLQDILAKLHWQLALEMQEVQRVEGQYPQDITSKTAEAKTHEK